RPDGDRIVAVAGEDLNARHARRGERGAGEIALDGVGVVRKRQVNGIDAGGPGDGKHSAGDGGEGVDLGGGEILLHVLRADDDVVVGDAATQRAAGSDHGVRPGRDGEAVPAAGPGAGRV